MDVTSVKWDKHDRVFAFQKNFTSHFVNEKTNNIRILSMDNLDDYYKKLILSIIKSTNTSTAEMGETKYLLTKVF